MRTLAPVPHMPPRTLLLLPLLRYSARVDA